MPAGDRVAHGDGAHLDERAVPVPPNPPVVRILLRGVGAGFGVRGVGRRPVVDVDVVIAPGERALTSIAERVLHQEAEPRHGHDGEVYPLPIEPAGHTRRPPGERGAEDDTIVLVDLPVAVLVDHADLAGSPPVPLCLAGNGILDLPDAAELVIVRDGDWIADEPLVAGVAQQAARQTHDPVSVRGGVDLHVPTHPVPVLDEQRGERHFDAGVARRADVLKNARIAGRRRELALHNQVAGVGPVIVDRPGEAVVRHRELESGVHLGRLLPTQIRVRQPAGTEADGGLVEERVHRPRQGPFGLIGIDRGVAGAAVTGPQLQVGEQPAAANERFLGEPPGERHRGEHPVLLSRREP